ncbi:MAG: insulinase family protein [bacterium]|nr:insulinase family protein [bacterium]
MKRYILALGLLFPVLGMAQLDRSVRPEAGPAPEINIEDSKVFTMENGLTVIVSENDKLPRVSFNLVMDGTPKTYGDMAGLPDIAGSLIMSGTTTRSKDALDREIDYIGANLSADNNSIRLSCLTKHMDMGLTLMTDVLMNANFPESEFDRIIKTNESNLASAKSDAGTMVSNARAVANFPSSHPYGEVMTEETLANITREAVVNYYKETFTPKGAYLVIVGDIKADEIGKTLSEYFEKWTGPAAHSANLPSAISNDGSRVIFVNKTGAVQSVISVTFPMDITPSHPDYLKVMVMNGIMGGGAFGNRLMQNLREDKAYTYGCRSSAVVTSDGSWFTAGGNFRNEVTDSSITEILYEIERIGDALVEDDELALTKASMAGSFARSLESPATVARFALNIIRYDLPKDYYQTYLQKLDAITKDDILEVAQKYMKANKANIVVVGNEEIVDRLTKFDSDGKIERMDAFGREVVEREEADITAEELFDKSVKAIAMGTTGKKLDKKLKKMKSMVTTMELSSQMGKAETTEAWSNDGREGSKTVMMGTLYAKSYFDGEKGGNWNMQTGTAEMTAEEIAAKKKSPGLIPEMNYATSGMEYEMLGFEEFNGKKCYLVKMNDGENETFVYYNAETYLKEGVTTIQEQMGQSMEIVVTYGDYTEYNGFLMADEVNQNFGGRFSLEGEVTERKINESFDLEDFK